MKMLRDMSRSAAFPSLLCIFCLLLLVAAAGAQTHGQSLALTESAKAFYRGDYSRAAELAGKHLRAYPKDVPVRLILARAELAQGKFQQAFEGLQMLAGDRKSTRLNSSHGYISYAVFCLKKKKERGYAESVPTAVCSPR